LDDFACDWLDRGALIMATTTLGPFSEYLASDNPENSHMSRLQCL